MTALTHYRLWTEWQARRLGTWIPMIVIVQTLLSAGTIYGYRLMMPTMDTTSATYLAAGTPTVMILIVGLVMAPQQLAESKLEGSWEFIRTLPVSRLTILLGTLTVWTVVSIPGFFIALAVAWSRLDVDLALSPIIIPVALAIMLMAAGMGFSVGALLQPTAAQVVSQILVFLILLFSPINFPASRLPDHIATLHQLLPFEAAGALMRAGLLTDNTVELADATTVFIWTVLAVTAVHRALEHRR